MYMNKILNFLQTKYKMVLIIISIILIFNVVLMIYLIQRYNHHEEKDVYVPMANIVAKYEFTFDNWGEIIGALHVTEGNTKELKASKVGKNIELFATSFVPYINENVLKNDSVTPEKFYAENKNYIFQYAGISEEKDFVTLCKELKETNCNINEFESASFIDGTSKYLDDIFTVDIKLKDKDGNTINVRVTTDKKTKNRFTYKILK